MANDEERLVVALEARINDFERKMQRAERTGTRSYQQLTAGSSRATRQMEQDMIRATNRINQALAATSAQVGVFGKAFGAGLGGLAGVLSVREVIRYADAWTTAKNSLAVAGVVGAKQVQVLDSLYQAAQRNAAPVEALADLFGKAAQASDNLGASQADLLKFSGGVATALRVAGTSATAASGALTQLGQLLGSARVQAEEFNSVNEGARPILIAVANGLDAAGGSVSRLKALVNDGKVSSQDFFNAFLKGLPAIEAMAANATQTIDQSWTKVNNALTRYIGETDSSLGASRRLVQGLNALADNFDQTADRALQLASVVAGALVGRSLFGMISTLGKGTEALVAFSRALAAARTAGGLAAAFGGLGAAAGPVGLLIGGTVVTALTAFSSSSHEASGAAKTYAEALELVRNRAAGAAGEIEKTTTAIDEKTRNALSGGIDEGTAKIDEARAAVLDLFRQILDNAPRRLITDDQLSSLEELRTNLENGKASADQTSQALYGLANTDPKFKQMADQLNPLLEKLGQAIAAVGLLQDKLSVAGNSGPSFRDTENASMDAYRKMTEEADKFIKEQGRRAALSRSQLALETEIAKVRGDALKQGVTLTEKQIEQTARANIEGEKARNAETKSRGRKASDYDMLTRSIRENIASMQAEAQALDMAGAAATAFRVEQELLNDAFSRGITVTPKMQEGFRQLAKEAGAAEEALSALKLSQDLIFERQQLGRSETEQRVYSELRSANIDINSTTGERLANEIRLIERLKEERGVIKDIGSALADVFSGGVKSFDEFLDRVMSGFAKIGQANLERGFENLFSPGKAASTGQPAGRDIGSVFGKIGELFSGVFTDRKVINAQNRAINTASQQITVKPLVSVMGEVGTVVSKTTGQVKSAITAVADAIRSVESGGNYDAIGPLVKKGMYAGQRAIGAYQVMPGNVPSWTKEALGYSMTATQFLTDRAAQDKVVLSRLQNSFDRYGNWMDAISVHFTGQPLNKARPGANDGYNTLPQYMSKVMSKLPAGMADPSQITSAVATGTKQGIKAVATAGGSAGAGGGAAGSAGGGAAGGPKAPGGSAFGDVFNTAIGALGSGYQSQSAGMGALSGVLSGLMSGNPIAAVVGAVCGKISSLFEKRKTA